MALRHKVGDLANTLVCVVRTRLELFALEASGQKAHLVTVLGLTFAALLFLTLAVLVFTVACALYFWPTDHRYLALVLLGFFYMLLGLIMFWVVRNKLLLAPMPFSATLDELRRDLALIERFREPNGSSAQHYPQDTE